MPKTNYKRPQCHIFNKKKKSSGQSLRKTSIQNDIKQMFCCYIILCNAVMTVRSLVSNEEK